MTAGGSRRKARFSTPIARIGRIALAVAARSTAGPGACACMRKARCACASRMPIRANAKPSSSTPRAGLPAATVSISISRSSRRRGLSVSGAAAEKIYRTHGPDAEISVRLDVEAGRRAALAAAGNDPVRPHARDAGRSMSTSRTTPRIVLAEAIVFGRSAMGEAVNDGKMFDRWRVRRDGRLIFAETLQSRRRHRAKTFGKSRRPTAASRSRPCSSFPAMTQWRRRCAR